MILVEDILDIVPHRYPFLLVDRIESIDYGQSIQGYKNITFNEPFFQGHFPTKPIMPGVLIIEAMAQIAGILGEQTVSEQEGRKITYILAGVDGARFKKPVIPGDKLNLTATVEAHKRGVWKFDCEATVDGLAAAKAQILLSEQEKF